VLAHGSLTPDAIEYLGIAWSWVSGRGFVDPVLYSYYLEGAAPPVPALAMRAPVLPLLLALPLALGAPLPAVLLAHALGACAVGAAGVWAARRSMSAAGALAFGIAFCFSHPWLVAVEYPLTEAVSVGVLFAVVALAPVALRGPRAAAAFAALVFAAWLTRPNLAVALPAFAAAAALELGPRRALRSLPLWTALAVFAALQQGFSRAVEAATGFAPYAHYGVLLETTSATEAFYYQKAYSGWWRYLMANADHVAAALAWNARGVARLLFATPDYHYLGWLLAPALAHAWLRRDEHRFARLFTAAFGLALLAVVLAGWGAIDPRRLLLPAAACFWLLAAGALAAGAEWLERRARAGFGRPLALARLAPPLAALALFALSPSAAGTLRWTREAAESYWRDGPRSGAQTPPQRSLCAQIDRDAVVASPNPWDLFLSCGNAGWVRPLDLTDSVLLDRFLDERQPGYLLVERELAAPWSDSARLERLAVRGGLVLYRVRDAGPRSRPWSAPPPLAAR
jgi:hypothetical protein